MRKDWHELFKRIDAESGCEHSSLLLVPVAEDSYYAVTDDDLGRFGAGGTACIIVAVVENVVHRCCVPSDEKLAAQRTRKDEMVRVMFFKQSCIGDTGIISDVCASISDDRFAVECLGVLDAELLLGIARVAEQV